MIRIASGQAFWGDWPQAPALQLRSGPIDYLILDYLAEVTISILDKKSRSAPGTGYASDFISDIGKLLPEIQERGVKVLSSAGGVDARPCAEAMIEKARAMGVRGLKVAVVSGDDVLAELRGDGDGDDGQGGSCLPPADRPMTVLPLPGEERSFEDISDLLTSARVYLGAEGLVQALGEGADIVITGRCTDTALALAPMIHEFGIASDDWDALSLGTVVGHILECGAQSTGGNFLGDWRAVTGAERIGFPIAEIHSPNYAVITKHESLGGLVQQATVKEQLIYEIGDPRAYITADCIPDFTSIRLSDAGEHRVGLRGVTGSPRPEHLKVSCVYDAGWKSSGQLTYCWPEAFEKARAAAELLRKRTEQVTGEVFDEWRFEYLGKDACHLELTPEVDIQEVTLRASVRSAERSACYEMGRELIGLILTGPPGATGYAGGRPRPSRLRSIWSGLVHRDKISPRVEVLIS